MQPCVRHLPLNYNSLPCKSNISSASGLTFKSKFYIITLSRRPSYLPHHLRFHGHLQCLLLVHQLPLPQPVPQQPFVSLGQPSFCPFALELQSEALEKKHFWSAHWLERITELERCTEKTRCSFKIMPGNESIISNCLARNHVSKKHPHSF